jgi:hypothetical protein
MGAFLMGVGEKARFFCGVLMVKSRWIRGVNVVDKTMPARDEKHATFVIIFFGFIAGGSRGRPEFCSDLSVR